jgi:FtsH-binding integral membrane protein
MPNIFKKIKNLFYWLGSLIFSGLVFLMTNKVLAQRGPITNGVELVNPLGEGATFITIINNILNYLIYISVPILAIMILVGGFQVLTARDNPEKIQSGRKTLMYAVIGFAIILISKGVALIILKIIG